MFDKKNYSSDFNNDNDELVDYDNKNNNDESLKIADIPDKSIKTKHKKTKKKVNFLKVKKIRTKFLILTITLIITIISISGVIMIINQYRNLYSELINKSSVFAEFTTKQIYSDYSNYYIYKEEYGLERLRERYKNIMSKNKDLVRFLIVQVNGEVLFDSNELNDGWYDGIKRAIRKDILQNVEKDTMTIRKVKVDGNMLLEFTFPNLEEKGIYFNSVVYYFTDKRIDQNIGYTTFLVILLSLGFIIVGIFIAVFYSLKLVKPIQNLVKSAEKVSIGDYDVNVTVRTNDELRILAEAFNKMVQRIREYKEQMEELVLKRTDELNKANKTLTARNKQMQFDLEMARRVQENIIPTYKTFPKRNELLFGSSYNAMESVGGDLYDIVRVGKHGYGFLMADVSGHGVPAALITTMIKVSFINHSGWGIKSDEVCDKVNQEMLQFIGDLDFYATAYYAILNLETGEFGYTNCGHHPALIYRKSTKSVIDLDSKGFFIGVLKEASFECNTIELEEGDRILLYTDGVTEARNNEGEFFGHKRLYNFIKNNSEREPKEFVDRLVDEINEFCNGASPDDDRAILYIEFVSKLTNDVTMEDAIHIESKNIYKSDTDKNGGNDEFINLYKKACSLLKSEDYENALNILLKINKEFPQNVNVLNNLAVAYYKLEQIQKAHDILIEGIRIDKNNNKLKKNLKFILTQLK